MAQVWLRPLATCLTESSGFGATIKVTTTSSWPPFEVANTVIGLAPEPVVRVPRIVQLRGVVVIASPSCIKLLEAKEHLVMSAPPSALRMVTVFMASPSTASTVTASGRMGGKGLTISK